MIMHVASRQLQCPVVLQHPNVAQ